MVMVHVVDVPLGLLVRRRRAERLAGYAVRGRRCPVSRLRRLVDRLGGAVAGRVGRAVRVGPVGFLDCCGQPLAGHGDGGDGLAKRDHLHRLHVLDSVRGQPVSFWALKKGDCQLGFG